MWVGKTFKTKREKQGGVPYLISHTCELPAITHVNKRVLCKYGNSIYSLDSKSNLYAKNVSNLSTMNLVQMLKNKYIKLRFKIWP